ncbi:MAG: hypothetical protein QXJ69_01545 [Desulfurococcaceae archaeon]
MFKKGFSAIFLGEFEKLSQYLMEIVADVSSVNKINYGNVLLSIPRASFTYNSTSHF